jgi:hypothetical protein
MDRVSIHKSFLELQSRYRRLSYEDLDEPNGMHINGILDFSARGKDQIIEDSFEILISISELFPQSPPSTKEIGGRIPNTFHHFHDGSLCLGAPLHIRMTFLQNPTLLGYVENLVIPYLFSFCYWEKLGKMPFGELSHGINGIMEYYRDLFSSKNDMAVINILKTLAENKFKGHHYCPCGSGKIIRKCHGEIFGKIRFSQSRDQLIHDYYLCLQFLDKSIKKCLNCR